MKHIYIHVPFCSRRCIYCDFSIAVRRDIPARRYVNAIVREYEQRKANGEWDDSPLQTLYLGGGTPSLLPAEHITDLLAHMFDAEAAGESDVEVTLEANPEHVSAVNARAWVQAGVNRVSVGAQSFDQIVLEWMHRSHSPHHVVRAVRYLREGGVESISIDLISALPPHLGRNLGDDLSRVLELEPEHVSVYGLTVEPRTALSRWIARGSTEPATDEAYSADFLLAHEKLIGEGYEHYEVSNYALPGTRSKHNSAYWDGSRYAGLGPSAHGYDGCERRWNVAPWAEYERRIAEAGDATGGRELLTPALAELERVYLGLRVSDGLLMEEMSGLNRAVIAKSEYLGWAESNGRRWCLTAAGWLRLDEIVTSLTTSPEGG